MVNMNSEAHQESEDNSILGKRKRSPSKYESGPNDQGTPRLPKAFHKERPTGEPILDIQAHGMMATGHDTGLGTLHSNSATSFLDLPPVIIQHILCLVDPFSLAQIMRVNQRFRTFLDPEQLLAQRAPVSKLPSLSQDCIWSISRGRFLPNLPRPLGTISEYKMLRLIYGRICDFCGRKPSSRISGIQVTPWNSGPGIHGVRTIWPFKVKSCTKCLQPRLVEEAEVSPALLQLGLPFVSFTPSLNYVTSFSLNCRTKPRNLKLTKYYFRPQMNDLETSVHGASLNSSAVNENWFHSIRRGFADFAQDCGRLEYWEESPQPVRLISIVPSDSASASSISAPSGIQSAAHSQLTSTSHTTWQYFKAPSSQLSGTQHTVQAAPELVTSSRPQHIATGLKDSLPNSGVRISAHVSDLVSGQFQTIERLRANKRAEIQQKCSELPNPILPHELEKLKAFQAAIHLLVPLDDISWSLLRDQLLSERQEATICTLASAHKVSSLEDRRTVILERSPSDFANPVYVKAQAQRPTRDKLYEIAQEFIKRLWRGGTNMTEATAPQFAADVLQYVRQRFYENQEREDAILAINGQPPVGESHSGIRTRVLNLEHMKHVFTECIKPYTEYVCKDLFRCSACEDSDKHFPFDAIIQHYAAKHTKSFGRGNTVLSWKVDWPLHPPFHTRPSEAPNPLPDLDQIHTPTISAGPTGFGMPNRLSPRIPQSQVAQANCSLEMELALPYSEVSHMTDRKSDTIQALPTRNEMNVLPRYSSSAARSDRPGLRDLQPYHYESVRFQGPRLEGIPTTSRTWHMPTNSGPMNSHDGDAPHYLVESATNRQTYHVDERDQRYYVQKRPRESRTAALLQHAPRLERAQQWSEYDNAYSDGTRDQTSNEMAYSYDTTEGFLASIDRSTGTGQLSVPTTTAIPSRQHPNESRTSEATAMDRDLDSSQPARSGRESSPERARRRYHDARMGSMSDEPRRDSTVEYQQHYTSGPYIGGHDIHRTVSPFHAIERIQRRSEYIPEHVTHPNVYHDATNQNTYESHIGDRQHASNYVQYVDQYGRHVHAQPSQIRYRSPSMAITAHDEPYNNVSAYYRIPREDAGMVYEAVPGREVAWDEVAQPWYHIIERPTAHHVPITDRRHDSTYAREEFDEQVRLSHGSKFAESHASEQYYRRH